jgi:hypothetical protein
MNRTCLVTMFMAALAVSLFFAMFPLPASSAQTILFTDDFGSGNAARWQLPPPEAGTWLVVDDGGNVLSGSQHSTATTGTLSWSNYSLKSRIKLMAADSAVHITVRTQGYNRYYVGFNTGNMYLHKTSTVGETACADTTLVDSLPVTYASNQWYTVEVVVNGGNIKVYVDTVLKMDVTDDTPLLKGAIAFEVLNDSPVHFDDVVIATDEPLSTTPWVSTGGPLGGLGYDVRIHPADKRIMYVTDNYAGVARSDDGGQTWSQTNAGITVKGGTSGDAVNIFSLTVDPNDPTVIWAGTNGEGSSFGVFKSTDNGATWTAKTAGMALDGEIGMVFRGFTIQALNSDVVYAQAEIPTTVHGWEFNRVKGRVYKTTDGGASWNLIWQGNNLARYLIIDPGNPDVLYLSTGIFDREAYDSDCANGTFGGLGVLKSVNGGQTWTPANNGLSDLYVGSLRMHPANPQILFAATGSNSCSGGYTGNLAAGLFRTTNGGDSWTKVISDDIITTVNFSPSSPDTVYAGSSFAFYRSRDGGTTWSKFSQPGGVEWGPTGVRAGVPIDVTVDPNNPSAVYANNYGGGVFRSLDGTATWSVWSKGYSGADIHMVHIPASTPSTVYAIGRSGPFASSDYGVDWVGIANGAATYAEWDAVAAHPAISGVVLISDEHQGVVLRSADSGNNFSEVLRQPAADAGNPAKRQGFRGLAFAPSNPAIVYAGLSKDRGTFLSSTPLGTVIYKSVDGGLTFSPKASVLDGINVRRLVVDPNNANLIYAATTSGVYKSSDGAGSWTPLGLGGRQIEALAINPQQPGYLIAGEIFGGIWVSINGGDTWAGPNNSGFNSANPYVSALVMDPLNPDTIYAGDLYSGIYQSLDKGSTWAPFPDWKMSGLTIRAVKDIAVGATVMYAATQGGGVFRFGRTPDTTPPVVIAFTASSPVNGQDVPVSAVAGDNNGVTGYLITESAVKPALDAAGWSGSVPTSYHVSTASWRGTKTLYVWAKDAAGNISAYRTATVTQDTAKPVVSAFKVTSPYSGTKVPIKAFTARDNVKVTGYRITESGSAPAAGGDGWGATAPTGDYTPLNPGDQTLTLYAWARDSAGNVSLPKSVTAILDTTPPAVAFTVPAAASGYSKSRKIPVSFINTSDPKDGSGAAGSGIAGYMVTSTAHGVAPTPPATWLKTAPTTVTVTADGTYDLYGWAKDRVGNVSAPLPPQTVTVDTVKPVVNTFTLTSVAPNVDVPVSISAGDNIGGSGVAKYLITATSAVPLAGNAGWSSSIPTSSPAFPTAGTKTLYAWAMDVAGNISARKAATCIVK